MPQGQSGLAGALQRSHGVLPRITSGDLRHLIEEPSTSTKPWRIAADNGPYWEPVWNNDLRLRLREVSASAGRQALIGQLYAGLIAKIPAFLKSCILRAPPGVIGTTAALANRRRPRLHHYQIYAPLGYRSSKAHYPGCDLIDRLSSNAIAWRGAESRH